jgi:8-hydroxy-5-deazaflavin:NADPH oxidoreductase
MKIGILGTGDVGRTLANGFLATGHQVMMGSREASNEKVLAWAKEAGAGPTSGSGASTGTFADAAKFAEVVVLAVSWLGAENALQMAGAESLSGKVVIDAINPLALGARGLELAIGHTDSAGEQVQRWLPGARVVKAFNSVGYAQMFKPEFAGGPPDMFICGNDDAAKKTVTDILMSFGWSTIDIGGIEGARLLEPLCMLWITYATRAHSHSHAFKLLRK